MRVHLFPPYRQQLTTDGAPSEHTRGKFIVLIDRKLVSIKESSRRGLATPSSHTTVQAMSHTAVPAKLLPERFSVPSL